MTPEQVQEAVDRVKYWHHRVDVNGVRTPGHTDVSLEKLGLTEAMVRGRTVLDVGSWDGGYAFLCERAGAKRVMAVGHFVWQHPDFGMDGFLLARDVLGSLAADDA